MSAKPAVRFHLGGINFQTKKAVLEKVPNLVLYGHHSFPLQIDQSMVMMMDNSYGLEFSKLILNFMSHKYAKDNEDAVMQ